MRLAKISLILFVTITFAICVTGCSTSRRVQPHSTQNIDTLLWKSHSVNRIDKNNLELVYRNGFDSIVVKKHKGNILELRMSSSEQKLSYVFQYYENGRLKRNYVFDSIGLRADITYYDDEFVSLKSSFSYENGLLNGFTYHYYPQEYYQEIPKIRAKFSYLNGQPHGESFLYRKNGSIYEKMFHDNGVYLRSYLYNKKGVHYRSMEIIGETQ